MIATGPDDACEVLVPLDTVPLHSVPLHSVPLHPVPLHPERRHVGTLPSSRTFGPSASDEPLDPRGALEVVVDRWLAEGPPHDDPVVLDDRLVRHLAPLVGHLPIAERADRIRDGMRSVALFVEVLRDRTSTSSGPVDDTTGVTRRTDLVEIAVEAAIGALTA